MFFQALRTIKFGVTEFTIYNFDSFKGQLISKGYFGILKNKQINLKYFYPGLKKEGKL